MYVGTLVADCGLKVSSRNSRAIIVASIDICSWAMSPTLKVILHWRPSKMSLMKRMHCNKSNTHRNTILVLRRCPYNK